MTPSLIAAALAACRPYEVGGDRPPFLEELQGAPPGRDLTELLERGARASENFRRTLVVERGGETLAREIAELIVQFTQVSPGQLDRASAFEGFTLSAGEIEERIIGLRELSAGAAYDAFAGKWFGRREDLDLDQHRGRTVVMASPHAVTIPPGEPPVEVAAWQYAWGGDGYGLNFVASSDLGGGPREYLLGYFVRFRDGDPRRIEARRPQVGVEVAPGRLIWITAREVILAATTTTDTGEPAYAVAGFAYKQTDRTLRVEKGFETAFTRDPARRPPWREFPLRLRVDRRSAAAQSSSSPVE